MRGRQDDVRLRGGNGGQGNGRIGVDRHGGVHDDRYLIDMKLRLQALLMLVVFLLPGSAFALGVGQLQLESALNERFEARIPLLSATAEELSTLRVGLASPEMFSRAGLDRTAELGKLNFKLIETETTEYIHITSQEAIREPFLSFLLELSWANGRLYREYTVLLDPPMYDPEVGRIAAPSPAPAPSPAVAAPAPAPEPAYRHDVIYPDQQPRAPRVTPTRYTGGDYGPVGAGDTLWSIANAMRPSGVSTHQMMLALLRANPEAFIGNNINMLRSGAVLQMPDSDELQRMSRAEALAEVERQYGLWEDGRLAMVETPTERPDTVTPPPTPAVDEAPEAEAPAPVEVTDVEDSELRLLAATDTGEARPGDEEGAEISQLQGELAAASEEMESMRLENVELSERLIEAEELIEDLKRLIALKDDELASLQQRMAQEGAEFPEPPVAAVEEDDEPEVAVAAAEPPVEAPAETLPPETDPPAIAGPGILGMVTGYLNTARDFIMANLVMVGGGLAALLALLAGGVFASRRRTAAAEAEADRLVASGEFPDFSAEDADVTSFDLDADSDESESITEIPAADEDEDEKTVFAVPEPAETAAAGAEEPEEDPLAEVNVLMAYEHFDQAEEFVRNALAEQPDNPDYHYKLLEVFYAANNKKKYEAAARDFMALTGGEGELWKMAVEMWGEISPNRALFEAGTDEDDLIETTGGGGIVDITGDTAGGGEVGSDTAGGLDFDLGDTNEPAAAADEDMLDLTAGDEQLEQEDGMLDLTAALGEEDKDGMLDVTATSGQEPDDGALDFDMTQGAGIEEESEISPESTDDLLDVTRDGDLDLDSGEDLLDITAGSKSGTEPATGDELEFSLDDGDIDPEESTASALAEDDNSLDFETGLDFDTGDDDEEFEHAQVATGGDDNLIEFETDSEARTASGQSEDELTSLDEIGAELDRLEHTLGTLSGRTKSGLDDDLAALDASLELDISDMKGQDADAADLQDIDESMSGDEAGADMEIDTSQLGMGSTSDALEGIDDVIGDSEIDAEAERLMADMADLEIDLDNGSSDTAGSALDLDQDTTAELPSLSLLEEDESGSETDAAFDTVEMDATLSPAASQEAEFSLDLDSGAGEDESDDLSLDLDMDSIDMDSTVELPKSRMPTNGLSLEDDADEGNGEDRTVFVPRSGDGDQQSLEDELTTKLDLAKAYVELGDTDSARGILQEVLREGTDSQKRQAGDLLQQI